MPDTQHREWMAYYTNREDISDTNADNKKDYLIAVYKQLYKELDDLKVSQRQWLTWALSIITGIAVFGPGVTAKSGDVARWLFIAVFCIGNLVVTITLIQNSKAQKDLMKNIDRIHRVMGAFTKDYFYKGSSLLDPDWYGWGFYNKQSHERFILWCVVLIWLLVLVVVIALTR